MKKQSRSLAMDFRRRERRGGVDPRWMLAGLVLAVSLTGLAGCRHRRSMLRPRFLDAPTVLVQPAPETIVTDEPMLGEPVVGSPAFRDDFESSSPVASPPVSPGPPASSGDPSGEPELEPAAPRDDQTVPSRVQEPVGSPGSTRPRPSQPEAGPSISPPRSSRLPTPTGATRLTARGSSISQLVQARADDPIDLVQPPRADRPWRYVVLHHSGNATGGYAQLDRAHRERSGLTGCGYHFVIGNGSESPDGTIEVTRRWSDQKPSQHCRDAASPEVNDAGVAICLIGDFDQGRPTAKQLESARLLVSYLRERYRIPMDQVVGHAQTSGSGSSTCPGKNLPLETILGAPALTRR